MLKHERAQTFNAHCAFILLCICITLPSTSIDIFKTFLPDHRPLGPKGEIFLRADYSVMCEGDHDTEYVQFLRPWATVAVVVYPIGVNLLYSVLLWRNRADIKTETLKDKACRDITAIEFLYKPFSQKFFWWEAVDSVGSMLTDERS